MAEPPPDPRDWESLAGWWFDEVAGDPSYVDEVLPLAMDMLDPQPGARYLDTGCGEGRMLAELIAVGASPVGVDASPTLLRAASTIGAVVRGRLPDLGWTGDGTFDGALVVLVLEHLAEPGKLFAELHRVVAAGGRLAVVLNHPAVTSPGGGPFIDPADGEVLWRWGPYLDTGYSDEPAGDSTVRFLHRPTGEILEAAAEAGWSLMRFVERGPGPEAMSRDPLLAAQRHVPKLLGLAWAKSAD